MRKTKYTFLLVVLTIFADCSRVPITGRRQLDLVPDQQIHNMAQEQYNQMLDQERLSDDPEQVEMVQRVGHDIAAAIEQYFRDNNMEDELEDYDWEFNLIDDDEQVNAWAMPGGKVAFYTGILPVTQDETGLAVVMGHEIAHVVAKHGNERMSQALTAELGGVALAVAMRERPQQTQQLFMAAYGLGAQVGIMLPFSRRQESEADHLGLLFMAMAGYDPREAVSFWERMAEINRGPEPPELLATHPPTEQRIEDMQESLPEALEYYEQHAAAGN
ncbi:M48 family metallopeptidase [Cytophagaceae bacterium ABcell3]|nr:M48 family metallopeptidase [Cytophagaceae bacterium ABcell3]